MDKLQHIYDKHAGDFGLSGRKNPEQLKKLMDAIQAIVSGEDTQHIRGCYRGQEAELFFDKLTRNVVVMTPSGDLVAAYKASEAQAAYIQSTGRLN